MKDLQIVLVTGLSGSGKSTATNALEDVGYYCVDNIPVALLPKLLDLIEQSTGEVRKLALVIDSRERGFLSQLEKTVREIKDRGSALDVIYLDARDDALLRRFSETRRKHPSSPGGSVEEGIRLERGQLKILRDLADTVLDTSDLNVHQLREFFMKRFGSGEVRHKLHVVLKSFGYRNGVPPDSDLVMDVRFFSNPFFQDSLRDRDGTDPDVRAFLQKDAGWGEFLQRMRSILDFLLPRYVQEGKSYLTVSFGCTGGRHRSVAVAEEIAHILSEIGWAVSVVHRDVRTVA